MAHGCRSDAPAYVARRASQGRIRPDSASHVDRRLIEELRRLGEEVVDERVPQQLLDVIRAAQDRFDR